MLFRRYDRVHELLEVPYGYSATYFCTHDMRDLANEELSVELTQLIGQAIGSEVLDRGLTQVVLTPTAAENV